MSDISGNGYPARGNVSRSPSAELKFTPEQTQVYGAVAGEIADIRSGDPQMVSGKLSDVYSRAARATLDMRTRQVPTQGFEIGTTGLVVGASPESYLATEATRRLVDAGLLDHQSMSWYFAVSTELGRLNSQVDAVANQPDNVQQAGLDRHTAEVRRIAEEDVEVFIRTNQFDDFTADKLRLLVYSTVFSASKDPQFRGPNSPIVEKLVAYMS